MGDVNIMAVMEDRLFFKVGERGNYMSIINLLNYWKLDEEDDCAFEGDVC